ASARGDPARADGRDPQGARRRWFGGRDRDAPRQDHGVRDARRRPRAGRAGARPTRANLGAVARVRVDPHVPGLDDRAPWNVRTEDNLDITDARRILDEDHEGLGDVKDRIVEYLAVRKLRAERGLSEEGGRGSGAILTLIGPPGVGKTS